jgi:uncharacterized protein
MRVVVTGSNGFIGSALVRRLADRGDETLRLVRGPASGRDEVRWDPEGGRLDPETVEGVDAVVHLAALNLGARRWNEAHKNRVLDSRMKGTRLLSKTLASLERPPRLLVSASAVGVYGDRGDEPLTEESKAGKGFLAEVVKIWEAETSTARDAGIRVATIRSGLVLSPSGGILRRMLLPFRLGLGGRIGTGNQWWPWISLEDEIGAIFHVMDHDELEGPVNLTAPDGVTNAEFTKALGAALHRPAVFPVPATALKIALGREMAEELLLSGQHVLPKKLEHASYPFRDPELEPALRKMLE